MLLLDEPLGALDLKLRRGMQIELKRIQTEIGITFVHVTHDQEEAMTMADTIAVMNAGRIEQMGAPGELYEHPRSTFVANFLGQSNLISGRVSRRQRARRDGGRPRRHPRRARGPGTRVDGEVWVGVRPEKMRLVEADEESAGNRMPGGRRRPT